MTTCADVVAGLSAEEQAGQLYMVGVSTAGLDDATADAITAAHAGSVVLLGNSEEPVERIRSITNDIAALSPPGLPILVAADQEGGRVQRLRGPGFPDMPTALKQGALPEGELQADAKEWGRALAGAGILYNLAPVADVVPKAKQASNAPIGALRRNFGNDPGTIARAVGEFVTGMREAGVATSLKHFPGLGQVTRNTDFDVAVDDDVVPHDPDWATFEAGIRAGAQSVMVSSAIFTRLDPGTEGVFSEVIITSILREELGFDGVVIADDLGAAVAVADVPAAERGVRFIAAGGDLAIDADPALLRGMVAATLDEMASDATFGERVALSAERVLRLKASVGLVDCS